MYPKNYFETKKSKINKGTCFLIMPFAEKFNKVYEAFKDSIQSEEINLICVRGDDIHTPHILQSILDQIMESEFIIADLTDLNANVFYELGLVHAIKDMEKVIIVSQDTKYIPFDLKQFRCLIYEDSKEGLNNLIDELKDTFSKVSRNSYRISLKENHTIFFEKKIVGKENNLYNFKIESPYIGHGLIKLIIHYNEFRIDKQSDQIPSQFLYVSEDEPIKDLEIIPWTVSFIETKDNTGKISIDKK
ncbi:hypothetical protein F3J23_00795 [Chryseobacterium sp. Tr-659]|uniref:hypothetical protein n=1 Tax=Chryseobacterium sp. Tr-659 TaxID=2608340 RepID=UPI001421EDC7|nr:hypothetical protein [Chryseobacterium sp. Tr-659]NIF03962.1 hypothetical protein [Chryseobacterium sp. Tr-659]